MLESGRMLIVLAANVGLDGVTEAERVRAAEWDGENVPTGRHGERCPAYFAGGGQRGGKL